MTDVLIEDGLYAHLSAQSTITNIVADRIYPTILPQTPDLPAIVFHNLGSSPVSRQDGVPTLAKTTFQIDCFSNDNREAKLLAKAVREALESYVGMMGAFSVQAVFVLNSGMDDFDDVPNDFRIMSEYEIWHKVIV